MSDGKIDERLRHRALVNAARRYTHLIEAYENDEVEDRALAVAEHDLETAALAYAVAKGYHL